MIPLEVTHTVLVTPEILGKMANIDNETLHPLLPSEKYTFAPDSLPHRHVEYKEVTDAVQRNIRIADTPAATASQIPAPIEFSSSFAECFFKLLTFFKNTYCKEFGFIAPPLHDPCTIFYLTNPECFHAISLYVDVEVASDKCAGRTLCDLNNLEKKPKNMLVCTAVDTQHFWQNMLWCVQKASANSPLNDE